MKTKKWFDLFTIVFMTLIIGITLFGLGYGVARLDATQQPSSLKQNVPLNVLIGFADGKYKKDYIDKNTSGNLHDWLVNTALENATSANLTWNYTPFKEYGTLTVNWEK